MHWRNILEAVLSNRVRGAFRTPLRKLAIVFRPCQTSKMKLFYESSLQVKAINYFCKKFSSQIFDKARNTRLPTANILRKCMLALYHLTIDIIKA